jgi:hypothetical protein
VLQWDWLGGAMPERPLIAGRAAKLRAHAA